jgi:hypothetical protein
VIVRSFKRQRLTWQGRLEELGGLWCPVVKTRRAAYISFATGCAVATLLALIWRLVNTGKTPLTLSQTMTFSDMTSFLWPSSLLLIEADPIAPLNIERATLYATAILLNGLWYAFVVVILGKIKRAFGK